MIMILTMYPIIQSTLFHLSSMMMAERHRKGYVMHLYIWKATKEHDYMKIFGVIWQQNWHANVSTSRHHRNIQSSVVKRELSLYCCLCCLLDIIRYDKFTYLFLSFYVKCKYHYYILNIKALLYQSWEPASRSLSTSSNQLYA